MSGFFYQLGRHLGHKAIPAVRKSKLIWQGLAGDEAEALRAEAALGAEMAVELRAAFEPARDPQAVALVTELGGRLAARARDKRRNFRCELVHDRFANAIALPGGFIFLSDALVELGERRPEGLAFVIGHEMAHVLRGHAWDRMLNDAVLRAASLATIRVGRLGGWLRNQGLTLLRSAHTREQELEADELGVRLAAAAGYPVAGATSMLRRIQQFGPNPVGLGEYLTSHPPAAERITRLQPVLVQVAASG